MTEYRELLLQKILSQPTAPFREGHVISLITQTLKAGKVPFFIDPIGNIVVGATSPEHYQEIVEKDTSEPLRVFIAHMDHPGFHGMAWTAKNELEVEWHGGSPTQHLEGAKVWLADRKAWLGHGTIQKAFLTPSGKSIESALILPSFPPDHDRFVPDAPAIFGGFRFRAPVWTEGSLIYTQAADDLVGAFAIVSLALDLWGSEKIGKHPPFLGLLTRAEEVGFIGAIGHFELGWLEGHKRPIICVSLETSRTLPGAEIGKGPIIRLGDRYTVFDPGCLRVFADIANEVLPGKHQCRIMDGGTCEATAATVFGFPCIGISIPLGNYHNQSLEGGPDAAPPHGPAPEFVHNEDVQGLIKLCEGLLQPKLPWAAPWKDKMKEFKKDMREYRELLRSGP